MRNKFACHSDLLSTSSALLRSNNRSVKAATLCLAGGRHASVGVPRVAHPRLDVIGGCGGRTMQSSSGPCRPPTLRAAMAGVGLSSCVCTVDRVWGEATVGAQAPPLPRLRAVGTVRKRSTSCSWSRKRRARLCRMRRFLRLRLSGVAAKAAAGPRVKQPVPRVRSAIGRRSRPRRNRNRPFRAARP